MAIWDVTPETFADKAARTVLNEKEEELAPVLPGLGVWWDPEKQWPRRDIVSMAEILTWSYPHRDPRPLLRLAARGRQNYTRCSAAVAPHQIGHRYLPQRGWQDWAVLAACVQDHTSATPRLVDHFVLQVALGCATRILSAGAGSQ